MTTALTVLNVHAIVDRYGDYVTATKEISKQYNRGVYSKEEYDLMIEIISSEMVNGWRMPTR